MPAKLQTRWAVVFSNGQIHHGHMCYSRRDVIEKVVTEFRGFRSCEKYVGLTDAQFWRVIKRKRGWQVRRISLRVVR